jgi:hypothetical protein
VARAGDDVGDGVGDVLRLEGLHRGVPRLVLLPDAVADVLVSSVATAPGSTVLTRTCRAASSCRRASLKAVTPNLVML